MKIRIEFSSNETNKVNGIVRTLDPERETFTEDFLEGRTIKRKFGTLSIAKNWQEVTRIEIELKPKFVEQMLDSVKEFADIVYAFGKKLMKLPEIFEKRFSEWNQTKFEILAEDFFADVEKPELILIYDVDAEPIIPTFGSMGELFAEIKAAKDTETDYAFIKFEDGVAYELSEVEGIAAFAKKFC